jgi:hypothetical protein
MENNKIEQLQELFPDWKITPANGHRTHVARIDHKSYKAWINIYQEAFYVNGSDSNMVPINAKLLEMIDAIRG